MKINQQTHRPTKKLTGAINKLTKALLLMFILLPTAFSWAADFAGSLKGITITDSGQTNTPPVAVMKYTQNGGSVDFDASGSSDDGSIAEYRWDFGDGTTGTGGVLSHQFISGTFPVTLTLIDNLGAVSLTQANIVIAPPFQIAVNFQPADVAVPEGYVPDSNEPFDPVKGYGWPVGLGTYALYDRNSSVSPDQAYDTATYSSRVKAVWELMVPESGNYHVTVCMGDPRNSYGTVIAQIEGVTVVSGALSSTSRWIEQSADIDIVDGKLTLTFVGTDPIIRLCWIKVSKN